MAQNASTRSWLMSDKTDLGGFIAKKSAAEPMNGSTYLVKPSPQYGEILEISRFLLPAHRRNVLPLSTLNHLTISLG